MRPNDFSNELAILKGAEYRLNDLFNFIKHPYCGCADSLRIKKDMVYSARSYHLPKYELLVVKEIGNYISARLHQRYLPLDDMLRVSYYISGQIYELKRRFRNDKND